MIAFCFVLTKQTTLDKRTIIIFHQDVNSTSAIERGNIIENRKPNKLLTIST